MKRRDKPGVRDVGLCRQCSKFLRRLLISIKEKDDIVVKAEYATRSKTMYTRMLIPLDGSATAEGVLPYARTLARGLSLPVELLGVVDIAAIATHVSRGTARHFDAIITENVRGSEDYLKRIAETFPGASAKCTVERGTPEEVILERAVPDTTLIAMATHGRSGMNRFLMGSIAEKVLRAATTSILLIRPNEGDKSDGEASLNSVIVPLDGSELAETALGPVTELAKALKLDVELIRAYQIPVNTYAAGEAYYPIDYEAIRSALKDEAQSYVEKIAGELKAMGVAKVSFAIPEGFGADEIIAVGQKTPNNLIAMCTHGRSGVKRWVLGSVTEKVVRHSGDPVLVLPHGATA
ncbi:MAG: universal stress protein [Candidatus Binatia bacterium]